MFKDELKANLVVIIPAYEPPAEFVDYAKRVADMARCLVVVNDGSSEQFDDTFREIAEYSDNVTYLTYGENRGKGFALKHAYEYCAEEFLDDTILVTADCDGQHSVKDIVNVYKAAVEHPEALTLGSRDFSSKNVPFRSKIGNYPMCAMFRIFYGQKLHDTQTGLRGCTVAMARNLLRVKGNRFEYELGCLIWSRRHHVDIVETPIDTIYPEDPADHVSHYKTIRDSLRVLRVMLTNLAGYLISSFASAAVEMTLVFLLSLITFENIEYQYLAAFVTAIIPRVVSSILNFALNYTYVFSGARKRSIVKYYILWTVQFGASYGFMALWTKCGFHEYPMLYTLMTGLSYLFLSIISYQVQQHWVFTRRDPNKIWGRPLRGARTIARIFSKKYRSNVLTVDGGAVYVCRHLNMHGPYTTLKWLDFDVRPMVFSPFFTMKECYRQYADYTFTKRVGKKKRRFNLKAFLASRIVPFAVKQARAIPVYRGSINVTKTFRQSMDALERGESLIVYPDVDYVGTSGSKEIYDGFLYLGEIYRKKFGKPLKFVPIYIDDENMVINAYDYVTLGNFKAESEGVAEYLRCAINGCPEASSYLPPEMRWSVDNGYITIPEKKVE